MSGREVHAAIGDRESAEVGPIIDDASAVIQLFAGHCIECAERYMSCECGSIPSVITTPTALARILSSGNREDDAVGHDWRIRHRHGLGNPHWNQRGFFIFNAELEGHNASAFLGSVDIFEFRKRCGGRSPDGDVQPSLSLTVLP